MPESVFLQRAHAVVLATIGKTAEVSNHILEEFTERLTELPYIEEVSYEVYVDDEGHLQSSLIVNFTNGPTRMWSTTMSKDLGGVAPQFEPIA